MAKQDYLFRYLSIIKFLRRKKEASFQEIREYLENEAGLHDREFSMSLRTFQRDLNEIRDIFRIDIRYSFSSKFYSIAGDLQSDMNNRMIESIDTINSLKLASDLNQYMFFEKRKAAGTNHFHGLLHAIKNRIILNLIHQKFEDDEPTARLVHPLALKESKGRWYLFARDTADRRFKTFGLDRILDFNNTAGRFDYPDIDINEHFRYCFGVINPEGEHPEEIVLTFDAEQGKYIKTYPLHETQEIVEDHPDKLTVRLKLFITYDLVMELLSYGKRVNVKSPGKLIKMLNMSKTA